MRVIYKYPISLGGINRIQLPMGATFRIFAEQNGQFFVWFEVYSDRETEYRDFVIHGTGHEIENPSVYRGTTFSNPFVWHLFEL